MFDNLQDRLQDTLKKVRGHGTLSEGNIRDALRDVRMALLEADVHFRVVKEFVAEVKARVLGQEVTKSLSPSQDFIRIVGEELTKTMGERAALLDLKSKPPIVIMLMGLQGSGKTTTSAKLARKLKADGRKPLLVPADVQRPAAIAQLHTLAKAVGVDAFETEAHHPVPDIAKAALQRADRQGHDTVIVDTAGRLQIDLELMDELRNTKEVLEPKYCLLVLDAMTGQEAVNVASEFHAQIGIDGVIMTKLDGDARGGAALSVRRITGAPIYFAGMGEKTDALEVFHPDRIAQRILGMGDVMSLIEKTQDAYDQKKARKMARKMKKADFSLDDFREQMQMIRKMGDMKDLLKMIPGGAQAMKKLGAGGPDPDKALSQVEAIISSMTPKERAHPEILNGSRRKRVASGSGRSIAEVNAFLKRFKEAKKVMKRMSKMGPGGLRSLLGNMPGRGGF